MKRTYNTDESEPTESNFKIPSVKEHLFQVTDVNPKALPSGHDEDIQIVKLEVIGGDEEGLTMITRVNLNPEDKAFYFSRLFLKAIGEAYKGIFDVETDRWIGRQFYATVKHTQYNGKTYANIDQYNFDKIIKQINSGYSTSNPGGVKSPEEIIW